MQCSSLRPHVLLVSKLIATEKIFRLGKEAEIEATENMEALKKAKEAALHWRLHSSILTLARFLHNCSCLSANLIMLLTRNMEDDTVMIGMDEHTNEEFFIHHRILRINNNWSHFSSNEHDGDSSISGF
jgi:hypothetical protein